MRSVSATTSIVREAASMAEAPATADSLADGTPLRCVSWPATGSSSLVSDDDDDCPTEIDERVLAESNSLSHSRPNTSLDIETSRNAAPMSHGKHRIHLPVSTGTASDHASLRYFLSDVFGGHCEPAYQASLEDPLYEPSQRLLIRRSGRIVAHAQLTERAMQIGERMLPSAGLAWMAVAADSRLQGTGSHLLAAVEKQMAQSGALIGFLRTRVPHFFSRSGWVPCARGASATAPALSLLAALTENGCCSRRRSRYQIRPWRRWEEEPLARIYRQNLLGSFGPLERSRAMWHWILERRAFDQFYVALDGPDLSDLRESTTQLVGYAVICGDRIVELMTAPGHEKAGSELLARISADALEQDRHSITLHGDPGSPLLAKVSAAGGEAYAYYSEPRDTAMACLLDPLGLLRAICPQIARRAVDAGLSRPLELGFLVEGRKFLIEVDNQGARASGEHVGQCFLRMNVADVTRMTLGQLDWQNAFVENRIAASTENARETAVLLFPEQPFWRPTLDDLFPG